MLPALSTNSNMPSGLGWERGVTELVTQNPGSGVNRRHICLGGKRARRRAAAGPARALSAPGAEGSKRWSFLRAAVSRQNSPGTQSGAGRSPEAPPANSRAPGDVLLAPSHPPLIFQRNRQPARCPLGLGLRRQRGRCQTQTRSRCCSLAGSLLEIHQENLLAQNTLEKQPSFLP